MRLRATPQEQERRGHLSWVNPFPLITTTLLITAGLVLAYKTGGNEHGASKNPGYDTMPYYAVGPMQSGPNSDPSLIYDARTAAKFVCGNSIIVAKLPDGSDTLTVRPVRDPAAPAPLVLTGLGSAGMSWSRAEAGTTYHYYDLQGRPAQHDGLNDCREEPIEATAVNDAANTSNHPYVLTGEHSSVEDGAHLTLNAQTAVDNDLVAFNMTGLTDDSAAAILSQLHHGDA